MTSLCKLNEILYDNIVKNKLLKEYGEMIDNLIILSEITRKKDNNVL